MSWSKPGNIKGPAGDDAYTVAVKAGFTGSKADWLASLKGAPGAPGAAGSAGPRGATWTVGSGPPTATAGFIVGDLYLDAGSGDVYQFS